MTVGQLQASVGLSTQPLVILPTEFIATVGKSVGTAAPCHWKTDRTPNKARCHGLFSEFVT